MQILETNRLRLRHFVLADLDELYRLVYADPQVKTMWSGVVGTPTEIKERFATEHIRPGGDFGLRAVEHKATGALLGLMGFQRHAPGEGDEIYYLLTTAAPHRRVGFDPHCIEAELTYAFGREHWKQGYAVEMGQALIAYGFEKLGLGRIIQGVRADNANSIRLMERLGFRVETGLAPNQVVGILEPAALPLPSAPA